MCIWNKDWDTERRREKGCVFFLFPTNFLLYLKSSEISATKKKCQKQPGSGGSGIMGTQWCFSPLFKARRGLQHAASSWSPKKSSSLSAVEMGHISSHSDLLCDVLMSASSSKSTPSHCEHYPVGTLETVPESSRMTWSNRACRSRR